VSRETDRRDVTGQLSTCVRNLPLTPLNSLPSPSATQIDQEPKKAAPALYLYDNYMTNVNRF